MRIFHWAAPPAWLPPVLVAVFLGLGPGGLAAQTLPLLTVTDGDTANGWWTSTPGKLSPVETSIANELREAGIQVLDPSAVASQPRISRILRRVPLSAANATNLAGLYGADIALVGQTSYATAPAPKGAGLEACEVRASLALLAVPSGDVLFEVQIARRGYELTAEQAKQTADARFLEAVVEVLVGAITGLRVPVGIARSEPFVSVAGLWDLASMERARARLRSLPTVRAVRVAWFAEGAVGFDVNPDTVEDQAAIDAVVRAVVEDPPEGVRLFFLEGGPKWVLQAEPAVDKEIKGESLEVQ